MQEHTHSAIEQNPTSKAPFRTAWGKLSRDVDGNISGIHTLIDHMIDVAACFHALSQCQSIRRAMDVAAGRSLSCADIDRLAVIAFLHDIGKANAGFQGRYWLRERDKPAYWTAGHCGHGPDGWALFAHAIHSASRILQGLPLEAMAEWGDSTADLLRASISHHGRPVDETGAHGDGVWQPVKDGGTLVYDPASTVAEMGRCARLVYPEAFSDVTAPLPDAPAFTHLFAGMLQLADWLGSDTRSNFFPYTQPDEVRRLTAQHRAEHAVQAIGLQSSHYRNVLPQGELDFTSAFGVAQPRPMQTDMASTDFGPIVVLEAETGSGKTEAALWRFLHLFRAGDVDALYFALPTRVAATQLHARVVDFVHRVWPTGSPVVVRALPGYTVADGETLTRLPDFEVLWSDKPEDREAERRWSAESPKRFLAATIAVGTVDQALLGALQVKHAHLRQAMLARSLLVVDEVHASDAYMTALLERLLGAHVACGGQALLLSATLGASARTRYLNVGAKKTKSPSLADARSAPYPAISTRTLQGNRIQEVAGNPRYKKVHWNTLDIIDDPARIAGLAVAAAAQGARVLIVRNTVPAAMATLRAVEDLTSDQKGDWLFKVNGVSTLHHSRFSRQDRPLLDAQVQAQIGKHRTTPGGRIVVGTQTLEQSLDIDADLLITDLCPMDVLLQRIGRLHRHERPSADQPHDCRPQAFQVPRAHILTPLCHDLRPLLKRSRHGLGPLHMRGASMQGVYVDVRCLEATRRLIEAQPTRMIPTDNRELVELATHSEALDAIADEHGEEWHAFGTQYEGAIGARASVAKLQALPFSEPFTTCAFPEDEHMIGSRLGQADRLIVINPPQPGPFGQNVQELVLRHHQLPKGLRGDDQPTDVLPWQGPMNSGQGFDFTLGSARYRYSRLGLERLNKEVGNA